MQAMPCNPSVWSATLLANIWIPAASPAPNKAWRASPTAVPNQHRYAPYPLCHWRARSSKEIALLPELIASHGDLCNACVNVDLDTNGYLADELLQASVQAVQQIALCAARRRQFQLHRQLQLRQRHSYFPAGYHRGELDQRLVLGLETPDLLVDVLQALQPERESLPHAAWMARATRRWAMR